jgi:hypothetical protein
LENRLALRNIPAELPYRIYREAEERFIDRETGYHIAVMHTELYGVNGR